VYGFGQVYKDMNQQVPFRATRSEPGEGGEEREKEREQALSSLSLSFQDL
jgi:hypothetical protein